MVLLKDFIRQFFLIKDGIPRPPLAFIRPKIIFTLVWMVNFSRCLIVMNGKHCMGVWSFTILFLIFLYGCSPLSRQKRGAKKLLSFKRLKQLSSSCYVHTLDLVLDYHNY